MPAINPQRLKELLIKDLLTSFAMKRRLSYAQLNDLVRRAMADKVFDLSASADEFANPFLDEVETTYWLENLERSGRAAHLFTADGPDAAPPEETYGGYTAAELQKLPPEKRLALANRMEEDRAQYA
jgi:hypothetical protein